MRRAVGFVVIAVVYAGLMVLAAGCAANKGDGAPAGGTLGQAMMCPKCQTVWVGETTDQGTKVQRYTWGQAMTCPDCDATAAGQLTGDAKAPPHNCTKCQTVPQPLTPSAAPGHPKGTHS